MGRGSGDIHAKAVPACFNEQDYVYDDGGRAMAQLPKLLPVGCHLAELQVASGTQRSAACAACGHMHQPRLDHHAQASKVLLLPL